MKKNNTAEKAILDAENISKALKESTEKSLKTIMSEAISKVIMESEDVDDEDDDVSEDSFEEEDVETTDTPLENSDDAATNADTESDDTDVDGESDNEWSDMEEYKVGDNDYDFTGVDDETALKVYNKLGDDDKIFVKKTDDGNYEVTDEETGAEYVIELDADSDEDSLDNGESEEMEFDIDIDSDDTDDFGDEDGDIDIEIEDGESDDFDGDDLGDEDDIDIEIEDDDDDDMLNEENLGYTTDYQKDVMPGLKMSEPADKKTTYSMDAGAPDGNKRPYSGYKNKESNLFTKSVNETLVGPEINTGDINQSTDADLSALPLEESDTISSTDVRHNKKTKVGQHRPNAPEYSVRKVDSGSVNESLKKILSKAKEIQAENKQYKKAIDSIKKSLCEAAVLNVTLAQALKLVCENTTSQDEKKNIVERFKSVKTIKESKELYNTISNELNRVKGGNIMLEKEISAGNNRILTETTIYQSNPSLAMMERMNNLDKMWSNK